MLRLDCFVATDLLDKATSALAGTAGVRHVTSAAPTSEGLVPVSADVDASSADAAIDRLAELGVPSEDVTLWRIPGINPSDGGAGPTHRTPAPRSGPRSSAGPTNTPSSP